MRQEITKKRRRIHSFLSRQKFFIINIIFLFLFLILIAFAFYHYYSKRKIFISPLPTNNQQKTVVLNNLKQIESLLIKNKINFSSVSEMKNTSILVKLNSGEEIFFSPEKSLNFQVSSLQLILSRLTIEGKRFNRIDFRYESPIITFN